MRWRSGSTGGGRFAVSLADQVSQSTSGDSHSSALPQVVGDEQDYSYDDQNHYDDDMDDSHGCASAVADRCDSDLPTLASQHDDDDDDDDDDMDDMDGATGDYPQSQHHTSQPHGSSSTSIVSSLHHADGQSDLPPSPTRLGSAITAAAAAAAAAAVVIDDDDDNDPGLDHALPPDECSEALNPKSWRPQNQQSTCEFTHTITHYSQKRESGCKKAEYSATTIDAFGNRWRLIVYVNGNGRASNHHLSLFLQVADADDLPFGWKKAVSYVLTLEHPSGPSLGYAKRNPDKTFKLCPKAIDWGWSQFITSDRIQQEGYISNDSLTVRASVTVKSSSVSIDPEDAELYLKCAVEEGNAEAVTACLAQGAGVNCQFKDDLYTPLHTACSSSTSNGSLEVLKLLLKRGADGNACNKWRETPLLIAANNGHRAAVEALLDSGADPSLCSEAGWSALTFAAHKGYDDIVALLLLAGAPVNCRVTEDLSTPLHKACAGGKSGHLSGVRQLIDGGADVHALNKWRETPLLTAANHGQADAVEALLRAGGDPCKCTDTGWSPLSIAAYKGHDDVVRLLLEEGAPTEEADPTLSALLQAATKGLPDTVELLLRHGADHTVTTKKGDTALSILVEQNLIDAAVEMVTEYKASVPRCSRDRKKVQRAKLLINLRIKQQQREGLLNGSVNSDEDDSEQDESDDASNTPLHDSDGSPKAATPGSSKKKKMKSKTRESAEAEARAAEEALLLQLEEEHAKAMKEEAAATSKRAKKKKKREQKQQKQKQLREKGLKEAEEREREIREKEEIEQKEREQRQREKHEREAKEQEEREKELRELELREAAAKEERAVTKRREKEERSRRQRELEKKERERAKRVDKKPLNSMVAALASSTQLSRKEKPNGEGKIPKKPQHAENSSLALSAIEEPEKVFLSKAPLTSPSKVPPSNKRGWETKSPFPSPVIINKADIGTVQNVEQQPDKVSEGLLAPVVASQPKHGRDSGYKDSAPFSVEDQLADMATGVVDFLGFDSPPNGTLSHTRKVFDRQAETSDFTPNMSHSFSLHHNQESTSHDRVDFMSGRDVERAPSRVSQFKTGIIEVPAVAVFRAEKVADLLRRCAHARSSAHPSQPMSIIDAGMLRVVIYRWIIRSSHSSDPFLDSVIPSWTDFDMLTAFVQRQFIYESRRRAHLGDQRGMTSIEALKEAGSVFGMLCLSLAKELSQFRTKCEHDTPLEWTDATFNMSANEIMSANGVANIIAIDWAGRTQVHVPAAVFTKLRARYRGSPTRFLAAVFAAVKRYEAKQLVVSGTILDYHLPASFLNAIENEARVSFELLADPFSVHGSNMYCGSFADIDPIFGALPPFGKDEGEISLLKHGGSVVAMPPLESATASFYMRNILNLLERTDGNGVPLSFLLVLPMECFRDLTSCPTPGDLPTLDPRLNDRHGVFIRFVEVLHPGQHVFSVGCPEVVSDVSRTGSLIVVLQNSSGTVHVPLNELMMGNILRSISVSYTNERETLPSHVGFNDAGLESSVHLPYHSSDRFPEIGGPVISNGYGSEVKRGRRGRLFELVDDGEEDNGNDVDVVSGMMNNLNVSMFQSSSPQDVDIEAISLMGINGLSMRSSARSHVGKFN